jgi:serine/threonine-protein kinase
MYDNYVLKQRYKLEDPLGAGGMAVVYRALDLVLERTVAIKILREDFSGDIAFRERFHQEAKAAANLSHPNIVTVHDFGLDNGQFFIVMENIPGRNLKDIVKNRGHLPVDEAIRITVQTCAGVGYAHRAGLVHCDLKPHNILVTPDQRVKVADFGISRALASIKREERSSVVWGSPQYFSPEQAAGSAPSPASDVYSIGVILFEMLTGQLPFKASTSDEYALLHRQAEHLSPKGINPRIPDKVEQIIYKVLSKEPAARYRTADQLGRVLITISQDKIPPEHLQKITAIQDQHPHPQQEIKNESAPTPKLSIDWITTALGLLALIAVGGLLPFWLWVYFSLNPPSP